MTDSHTLIRRAAAAGSARLEPTPAEVETEVESDDEDAPDAKGACWANTLARAGIFASVTAATAALDAQIEELGKDAGIPGDTWHLRAIDRAVCRAGHRIKALPADCPMRDVLEHGTYAVEGIQNKVWYLGNQKVDVWGPEMPGPDVAPSEWRHVVCVKDGKILDWEFAGDGAPLSDRGVQSLSALRLRADNTVDVHKGYFRSIHKVYELTPGVQEGLQACARRDGWGCMSFTVDGPGGRYAHMTRASHRRYVGLALYCAMCRPTKLARSCAHEWLRVGCMARRIALDEGWR